jgi:hypothetical protein
VCVCLCVCVCVMVKVPTGFSVVDVGTYFEPTSSKVAAGQDSIRFIPTFLHVYPYLKKWTSSAGFQEVKYLYNVVPLLSTRLLLAIKT